MDGTDDQLFRLTELLRVSADTARSIAKLRPEDAERINDAASAVDAVADKFDDVHMSRSSSNRVMLARRSRLTKFRKFGRRTITRKGLKPSG